MADTNPPAPVPKPHVNKIDVTYEHIGAMLTKVDTAISDALLQQHDLERELCAVKERLGRLHDNKRKLTTLAEAAEDAEAVAAIAKKR